MQQVYPCFWKGNAGDISMTVEQIWMGCNLVGQEMQYLHVAVTSSCLISFVRHASDDDFQFETSEHHELESRLDFQECRKRFPI